MKLFKLILEIKTASIADFLFVSPITIPNSPIRATVIVALLLLQIIVSKQVTNPLYPLQYS